MESNKVISYNNKTKTLNLKVAKGTDDEFFVMDSSKGTIVSFSNGTLALTLDAYNDTVKSGNVTMVEREITSNLKTAQNQLLWWLPESKIITTQIRTLLKDKKVPQSCLDTQDNKNDADSRIVYTLCELSTLEPKIDTPILKSR